MKTINQNIEIGNVDSFPDSIISILEKFVSSYDLNYISNTLRQSTYWYEHSFINNFLSEDLILCLKDALIQSNSIFNLYHTSVLLDFEIEKIEKFGLFRNSTQVSKDKIEDAFNKRVFTQNECDYLKKNISVKTQNPKGDIYVYTSFVASVDDNKNPMHFNQMWGGESINWLIDDPSITSKLKRIGFPVIICLNLSYNAIYNESVSKENYGHYTFIRLIVISYLSYKFDLKFPTNYLVSTCVTSIPNVTQIIKFSNIKSLNNHNRFM